MTILRPCSQDQKTSSRLFDLVTMGKLPPAWTNSATNLPPTDVFAPLRWVCGWIPIAIVIFVGQQP